MTSQFSKAKCLFAFCLFRRKIASIANGPIEDIPHQPRSKQPYTTSEDHAIIQGRQDGLTWAVIASKIGRSSKALSRRFSLHLNEHPRRSPASRWSPVEDASILRSRKHGETWTEAAAKIDRTLLATKIRYSRLVPKASRRTPRKFSKAEDLLLLQLRNTEHRSWRHIGRALARAEGPVRERYDNLSDHRRNKDSQAIQRRFSQAEDQELLRLREHEGLMFREVARIMGRRRCSIIRRFHFLTTEPAVRESKPDYSKSEDRRILELRDADVEWKAMTAEFPHRTPEGLRKRYERLVDRASWPEKTERDPQFRGAK